MITYLDPCVYCYDNDEWQNELFVDRFLHLLELFSDLNDEEKLLGHNRILNFRVSDDFEEQIYTSNPFLSNGSPKPFYQNQFQNIILPEILKRSITCPIDFCEQACVINKSPPAISSERIDKAASRAFVNHLSLCAKCGANAPAQLIYFNNSISIEDPSGYFEFISNLATDNLSHIIQIPTILPFSSKINQLNYLKLSLRCGHFQKMRSDPSWRGTNLSNVQVTENFWKSITQANFQGLEKEYHQRIFYTILQVACGKDETASEHRMVSQFIGTGHNKKNKWNAYVFKMGATDQDKRCSRLYFAKTVDGILLDAFEPNAHP